VEDCSEALRKTKGSDHVSNVLEERETVKRKTTALITGGLAVVAFCAALAAVLGSTTPEAKAASCARGTKPAIVGGNFKCLRVGQKCSASYQSAYRKYGFHCAKGRLRKGTGLSSAPAQSEPPYSSPPAPTPAAVDGHYKGVTSQNETFEFDIRWDGRNFSGLKTGQINQGCTPADMGLHGNYIQWTRFRRLGDSILESTFRRQVTSNSTRISLDGTWATRH
jgi:hypothetical protein